MNIYRKQIAIVIFNGEHAVPREEASVTKKPTHNHGSIFPLLTKQNMHQRLYYTATRTKVLI